MVVFAELGHSNSLAVFCPRVLKTFKWDVRQYQYFNLYLLKHFFSQECELQLSQDYPRQRELTICCNQLDLVVWLCSGSSLPFCVPTWNAKACSGLSTSPLSLMYINEKLRQGDQQQRLWELQNRVGISENTHDTDIQTRDKWRSWDRDRFQKTVCRGVKSCCLN